MAFQQSLLVKVMSSQCQAICSRFSVTRFRDGKSEKRNWDELTISRDIAVRLCSQRRRSQNRLRSQRFRHLHRLNDSGSGAPQNFPQRLKRKRSRRFVVRQ